jgi:zinc protease
MKTLLPVVVIFLVCINSIYAQPPHPSKLKYPSLDWKVPMGKPYRSTLSNGLTAYIVQDNTLPMVEISGYIHTGTLADPQGKEGLGALTFQLMRTGGTEKYSADVLDELCERLAITISVSMARDMGTFKASFLSEYTDTALYLLKQVLFHPVFDEKKLNQERAIQIDRIRHRFDDPGPILGSAYACAMYTGEANSRLTTEKSMASISRKDMEALHKSVFSPRNMITGVSGRFDTAAIRKSLESFGLTADSTFKPVQFPEIKVNRGWKCLVVHKPISQVYVRMGLPLFKRPHPDYYPVSVLDLVLGGSSFISRLGTTVRSDEGLTYSIHSQAESNYTYPGTLLISFFTKSETMNKAISISIREAEKLVSKGITDEELESAKRILIDALPSMFRSADDIADTYAWNEYYGRSEDHFAKYPAGIDSLTKNDISRVASEWLDCDSMTFVIVGDTSKIFGIEAWDGFSIKSLLPVKICSPDSIPFLKN